MKKKKYIITMLLALVLLSMGVVFTLTVHVSAAAVNNNIDDLQNLTGEAGYINRVDNYYLDMEETDWLETGQWLMNKIANMLFTFIRWLANVTVTLFYQCMNFDMAEMFKSEIGNIQKTLNKGIFQPLFTLAFCGSAIIMLKKMVRRDLMGAYGQVLKVIGIVILSILVVKDSASVLSAATGITKSISTQALVGMQGDEASSTSSYAAQSAGTLWVNLIHQPWLFIEFGSDPISDDMLASLADSILSYKPSDDNRKEIIKNYTYGEAFSKDRAGEKIGFMFLYIIPFAIKCVIYIVMALLTLGFQLIAIFYVVLAPVVLILTMIPGYESILTSWLRKMLESQISILIMSFIIGLLVKVDKLLFDTCAFDWGWLVVMIVQTVLAVFVIIKKDMLLGALSKLQKGAANSKYARAMMIRSGDGYAMMSKGMRLAGKTASAANNTLVAPAAKAGKRIVHNHEQEYKGRKAWDTVNVNEEAAEDGKVKKGAVVERPVMSAQREKAAGGEGMNTNRPTHKAAVPVQARSTLVAAQTPPKEVKRPRMDSAGLNNKIVQFEAPREYINQTQEKTAMPKRPVAASYSEIPRTEMTKTERLASKGVKPTQESTASARPVAHVQEGVGERIREQHTAKVPVKRPQSSVRPQQKENKAVQEVNRTIKEASTKNK